MDALPPLPSPLVTQLQRARRFAALTGAGISAESGVPTFRAAQTGLWARYRPEELATPEAFDRDPALVWSWYAWRRQLVAAATPNPGHRALVDLANHRPLTLITQNVDDLHRRAGSEEVVELHGNINRCRCTATGRVVAPWDEGETAPPPSPWGGVLRPDVVWFGEALPEAALEKALQAALDCEVFLVVGTSALVYPAAALPLAALEVGAMVVEINPEATPLSDRAHFSLRGAAGELLPQVVAACVDASSQG
ncbi:MAG: NAD-dependent deacetylase [Candidatus Competibacterales bacterium]